MRQRLLLTLRIFSGGPPADHRGTKNYSEDGLLPLNNPRKPTNIVSWPYSSLTSSFKSLDRNCSPISNVPRTIIIINFFNINVPQQRPSSRRIFYFSRQQAFQTLTTLQLAYEIAHCDPRPSTRINDQNLLATTTDKATDQQQLPGTAFFKQRRAPPQANRRPRPHEQTRDVAQLPTWNHRERPQCSTTTTSSRRRRPRRSYEI